MKMCVNNKLSIDFINEFLIEYDFERVDFVYEPGQFSIRGGIVDIFLLFTGPALPGWSFWRFLLNRHALSKSRASFLSNR